MLLRTPEGILEHHSWRILGGISEEIILRISSRVIEEISGGILEGSHESPEKIFKRTSEGFLEKKPNVDDTLEEF